MARCLEKAQTADGGFRHSLTNHSDVSPRCDEVHSFDTGICATALLDFAERWCDVPAREAAKRAVDWLVGEAQHDDGWFRCVWRTDLGAWNDPTRNGFWSAAGGCYHAKLLPLLVRLNHWDAAEHLLRWVLGTQRADGAWPAGMTQPRVHAHASCYALEGLLDFHLLTGDAKSLNAVEIGMSWLATKATRHAGVSTWTPCDRIEYRADAQVQFLRLHSLLGHPRSMHSAAQACRRRLNTLVLGSGVWKPASPNGSTPSRAASWPTLFDLSMRLPMETPRDRLV
jgi:hypothetical protein